MVEPRGEIQQPAPLWLKRLQQLKYVRIAAEKVSLHPVARPVEGETRHALKSPAVGRPVIVIKTAIVGIEKTAFPILVRQNGLGTPTVAAFDDNLQRVGREFSSLCPDQQHGKLMPVLLTTGRYALVARTLPKNRQPNASLQTHRHSHVSGTHFATLRSAQGLPNCFWRIDMFRLLKLAAMGLVGYAIYEFIQGLVSETPQGFGKRQGISGMAREAGAEARERLEQSAPPSGLSGPGLGRMVETTDAGGTSVRHRVGRGAGV